MSNRVATVQVGDLLEVQNGYAFDSKLFFTNEGMPLIRIRDLKNGRNTETCFRGSFDRKYVVDRGDFLIGMDGEFACYEWKGGPALLNQRICRLQNFSSTLVPRYLFYGINKYLKEIEALTGYTTVKHLSSRQILEIEMQLPPVERQLHIVGILDEAFDSITTAKANAERNLQSARALFESELQSVFERGAPRWRDRRLGSVVDVQSGGTPTVSRKDFWNGDIAWYSSGELNALFTTEPERQITAAGLECSNAKLFPKGSLLIGMYDTAALKMSILDRDAAFNQAIAGVRPNDELEMEFVLHAINAKKLRLLRERRGVRQKNLSLGKIKDIELPIPSRPEQRAVVSNLQRTLAHSENLVSIYRRKLATLDELKQSLLHHAFNGEL